MSVLFKHGYKRAGIFLVFLGILLSVAYVGFNFRFSAPVFAIYSEFLEVKTFSSFTTNFADELILILFLSGFFLIIFSKEKNENEHIREIRVLAFKNSLILYFTWLLFSVLFIFGNAFIYLLILNVILPFVIYLCFFYFLLLTKKRDKENT